MKVGILGFGREGKSVFKFLKKKATILDQKKDKNYLKNLNSFDLVFRSPGVPYNLPEIQKAIKAGVKFSSATKLFFELCPAPIIGITGTKGKGTTSTLIYQILKKCGFKVLLAGNIGKSPLEILPKVNKKTWVVLELSSFQLQDLEKSPRVAVVTDVFPDHMDAHKDMKEYVDAKSNIALHQKKSDVIFYFQDNLLSKKIAEKSPGAKIGITGGPFGLKKNYVLASTVTAYLGCPTEKIFHTVKNFRGVEHRMEFAREINGVRFYNDSASTNPQTAAAAVLSFKEPVVLIAGGKDKNLDYKPLAEAIKKSGNVKMVVLIGENKNKILHSLAGIRNKELRIKNATDLKSAVELAHKFARSLIHNSQFIIHVLFSPGAASFDMFKDYADRGEKFKRAVRLLKS